MRGPFRALFQLQFEGWAGVAVGVLVSGWELVHASVEEWARAGVSAGISAGVGAGVGAGIMFGIRSCVGP